MKRLLLILNFSFFIFHFSFNPLSAQVKNYLGVTANLGEYSLLSDLNHVSLNSSLGVGGTLGGVYELSYKHFIFDFGVNFQVSHSIFGLTKHHQTLYNQIDDEGDKLDYIYQVDKRKDRYTAMDLQVPLMFGGQWNKFYFMAGVKFDLAVYAMAQSTALLSAEGDYEKFIDNFKDMPQHGFFTNYPLKSKNTVKFNPELLGSLEIGWRIGEIYKGTGFDVPKQKTIYRLAFFADFGLPFMDRHSVVTTPPCLETPTKFDPYSKMEEKVVLHDILSSSDSPNKVNSILVGMKFTVLFQMPEGRDCVICRDAYMSHMRHTRTKGHYYTLVGKEKKK